MQTYAIGAPELTTFRQSEMEGSEDRWKEWRDKIKKESRFVAVLFAYTSISVCMDDRI